MTTLNPEELDTPRRSPLLPAIIVFAVLVAIVVIMARIWTDYLWYRELDMTVVYTTRLATQVGLFVVFGLIMAAIVYVSLALAYRLRPRVRHANLDSEMLVQLRDSLDRRSGLIMAIPAALFGLLGGIVAASATNVFLPWVRGVSFGREDATFGYDASFYVFSLPWWRFVLGYVTFALIVALIGAVIVHFLTGSLTSRALRGSGNMPNSALPAQRQLSITLGLVLVMFAISQFLDRYGLLTTNNNLFTGVNFTDANSRIPAHLIISVIALICALVCFYNAWRVRWSIPGVAIALLVVSSLILGIGYPWFIQTLEVDPDEPDKESPFIAENIAATRYAFDIDDVEIREYEATTTVSAGQLREDAASLPAIRLMDPAVIGPTFEQLQQVRGYYTFPETLDVDRYVIDGRPTDAVVAARELDLASVESGDTWNNQRTVYTHGYGMVAAFGNQRVSNGEPVFFAYGIPTRGELPEHEPRIYYGEQSSQWVVAGGPEDREPVELDTPGGGEGGAETKYTYTGDGGVPIGNFFIKLLYAIRFGDVNLMLSDRVNELSRIMYNRIPLDRVQEVAPWLVLDQDPYPSVVDGRIVWIIDAYTTTDDYPNSTRLDWLQAISDTRTSVDGLSMGRQVNYVRNSVKVTVDAYDGTVTLYEWDEEDPLLKTWSEVFPGIVTPKSDISPDLLAHLRYPQDLFKAQRQTLGRYHTTNTNTWYQQSDIWEVPNDPVSGQQQLKEPPYFLTIQWPDESQPYYSNTTVFVPRGRENLSVYMAVNADATSDKYGQIKALKLSDTEQIAGPGQTFNAIQTNEQVAQELLPFNRQGSANAIFGNLLTLPVGGGLLYVQPIYTQTASTTGSYPALRFVVVRFGEHVGIGGTLQAALDEVFQGDAGADTGENIEPDGETDPAEPGTPQLGTDQARNLLQQGMQLFVEAEQALTTGDLATYQAKNEQAQRIMEQALDALGDQ